MLSARQKAILRVLMDAGKAGLTHDIDSLMGELRQSGQSVGTKQSIQCSIRFMEQKGLVVRSYGVRRERRRMIIEPTAQAFASF